MRRPPKETMLLEAAPVACAGPVPDALAGRVAEPEAPPVAELGRAEPPVEIGTVLLTPGTMGVARVGTGAMGVAEATGGETTAGADEGTTGALTEGTTAETEGTTDGATGAEGVAGGAWIWPSLIWEMGWT